MPILEEQLGGQTGTIETYQPGSIFSKPEYQSAITMSIAMQDYITQKDALVTECSAFDYNQRQQWEDMIYHRESEAAMQIIGAVGMCVLLTVAAVTTAVFAGPLIFALYGTTTEIVTTGVVAATYAGAYAFQGSNMIEGINSLSLAREGDAASVAENPIRDTIFANNPELYYTLGDICTSVALTTPSAAVSMNMAVNLGVSPIRAALTEVGMVGNSEIAGRYVESEVYEQTGDPNLAMLARSGTSLLVYGGLVHIDARVGMSGIRQWNTPKVNPLEFNPPEQVVAEPNVLLYQRNPSTNLSAAGSMSPEDIQEYLYLLRSSNAQTLTGAKICETEKINELVVPDKAYSQDVLGLGDSDGGMEDISEVDRIKIDSWEYTPSDELYLKYKGVYDNPVYYDQVTGKIHWPADDGFKTRSKVNEVIKKGTIFKRYGENSGEYLGNATDSFESRALAPHSENSEIHYYRLIEDYEMTKGEVAPWFASDGGAEQFVKYKSDGSKYTVKELEDAGILEDITDLVEKGEIKID